MNLNTTNKTKKAYVKPVMESEAFVANEYVAACDPLIYTWEFKCDTSMQWRDYCPWKDNNPAFTVSGTTNSYPTSQDFTSGTQLTPENGKYIHKHKKNNDSSAKSIALIPKITPNASN